MIAFRPRPRRRLVTAAWWASIATTALAAGALVAVGPGQPAKAATTYDQMTGIGPTSSAITVPWTAGLLNAENQPITGTSSTDGGNELAPNSDRAAATPTGPLAFMYPDFKNLSVTVSQTTDITHQGITINWSGAKPTQKTSTPETQFLQMMECWGDNDSGPSPENCEFGSFGMLGSSPQNPTIGDREGFICATPGATLPTVPPSTTKPPPGTFSQNAAWGCDPYEPAAETITHCDPNNGPTDLGNKCTDGYYQVPFVGVDADTQANAIYGQSNLPADFNEFNSNEVQAAYTTSNGTGQIQFETLTNVEAPHLGCGQLESSGQPRGCWLVIVPRGSYEPNGFAPSGFNAPSGFLDTSPLSASNWAQRIQIHLDYAPLGSACPPTVVPDQTVGTQVISRAVSSWELSLNQAANCSRVYAFTATTENSATAAIEAAGPGNGMMAFTTIPIGSETTRYTGGTPPSMPGVLYAPVAVTAMDFGFNINLGSVGYDTTPVKLTPEILAHALTQVYTSDLPDYTPSNSGAASLAWVQGNPGNITEDPAFGALNSANVVPYTFGTQPLAPLLTEDHSELNQQVWQYIQTDPATSAWLDTASASTVAVKADPNYVSLSPQLGAAPAPDSFPRAYSGVLNLGECTPALGCPTAKAETLNSIDLLPYASDIGTAAATVLAASDSSTTNVWSTANTGPDGTLGWWGKVGVEPPGQVFMWALSDTPDLAAYGLIQGALCDPTGATCVTPSLSSVTTTVNAAVQANSSSTTPIVIDPASVPSGGYPLVQIVYAAVPTNQSAQSLSDYAALIQYAANAGQTTGASPGDLPPGYLPLTPALQAQANAVVQQLQQLASPSPSASASTSASATTSATQQTSTGGSTTTGGTTTGGTTTGGTTTGGTTTSGNTTSGNTTGGTTGNTTGGTTTSGNTTGGTTGNTTGGTTTSGNTTGGTTGTTNSVHPAGSRSPTPTPTPSSTSTIAFSLVPPSGQLAAGITPATAVGAIRRVLIFVLLIGAAGAVAGAVLFFGGTPGRRRTRRPRADP